MSTATVPPRLLTPDEVLDFVDGKHFELVDGQLLEKPMSNLSDYVGAQIIWLLLSHCRLNGVAHVFSETGYVCFPSKPGQMRRPDVSCVLTERLPLAMIGDGFLKIRPDLAIEVISPHDKVLDLEDKLNDYRDAAIPLVWLIYPDRNWVRVIRLDRPTVDLQGDDELTGEPILPGFRCRVAELFVQSGA